MNKITLDSNVFRNQDFINWLMSSQAAHDEHIFPLTAYIEVLVWYEMKGLTREGLDNDLEKIKTTIETFSSIHIELLMENIRKNPHFKFRHHARDFVIGTIAQYKGTILVTNNDRHFKWLKTPIMSPEKYLLNNISF